MAKQQKSKISPVVMQVVQRLKREINGMEWPEMEALIEVLEDELDALKTLAADVKKEAEGG